MQLNTKFGKCYRSVNLGEILCCVLPSFNVHDMYQSITITKKAMSFLA